MAQDVGTGSEQRLDAVLERLQPDAARRRALAELEEMFRSGRAPDPLDGMFDGRLVTTSIWAPVDAFGRWVAVRWMPWLGKSFDAASMSGVNVLRKSARSPMRVLWPSYVPERELADRVEAFPFRTRIAPGELDTGTTVLKIDYDFEANPDLVVRRILDELVEIDDGLYLGKILFCRSGKWMPIGFFTLKRRPI